MSSKSFAPLLGILFSIGLVGYLLTDGIDNPMVFLNLHGVMVVIGGTLSVSLMIFSFKQISVFSMMAIRIYSGLGRVNLFKLIGEIVDAAKDVSTGVPVAQSLPKLNNPFFKESMELLSKGGLSDDEFESVLECRLQVQNEFYKRQGASFKVLGKFPPAFGLVGATLGMITLLQGLGDPSAISKLGPSMSVALVATFYGLVVANFIIIPLGENLMQASQDDLLARRLVIDGVKLIRQKKHPFLVEEYLRSYLLPSERNKLAPTKV